jgi:hypothetical protein
LLAFVKLRRRNLGPILDANGWAINTSARINVPFGTRLTDIAELPPGSSIDIHDRYAEKSVIWPKVAMVLLIISWLFAYVWDVGILHAVSKDWKIGPFTGPFGKPPASQQDKNEKDKTSSPEPTNSPQREKVTVGGGGHS